MIFVGTCKAREKGKHWVEIGGREGGVIDALLRILSKQNRLYIFNSLYIVTTATGHASLAIDPFNNDVIHGKALKSVSFVLNEFSQIANTESKLTTYWNKRGEQLRNE